MDYKDLIEKLRNKCGCNCECLQAADALENLLAERDAAVAGLIGDCSRCVYAATPIRDSPCNDCRYNYLNGNPLRGKVRWRWHGPQKERENNGQA